MSSEPSDGIETKKRTALIKSWWENMQSSEEPQQSGDKPRSKNPVNRALLARLRRCHTLPDILTEQATIKLARICEVENERDLVRVGLVASVLVHVREDMQGTVSNARMIGPKEQDDQSTALCKLPRFRRLLAVEDVESCQTAFRRLVALMGNSANIADLADSLWDWPFFPRQEERAKRRRVQWVCDYWDVGMPQK